MDFSKMPVGHHTSLRALLDNSSFCDNIAVSGRANISALKQQPQDKIRLIDAPETETYHPSVANLMRDVQSSIWGDFSIDELGNNAETQFDLEECMDLDEYLTGLNSTEVVPLNQNSPVQVSPEPSRESTPSDMPTANMSDVSNHLMVEEKSEPAAKSAPAEEKAASKSTEENKKTDEKKINITKKRRFEQDGEGLGDASVIVVPGQAGFDPQTARFKPEELQPQPIIKKSRKILVPDNCKDDKYWRRRNKNNVAAKRSREARRAKENQIVMRASFLESENERLTEEMEQMAEENSRLQQLLDDNNILH